MGFQLLCLRRFRWAPHTTACDIDAAVPQLREAVMGWRLTPRNEIFIVALFDLAVDRPMRGEQHDVEAQESPGNFGNDRHRIAGVKRSPGFGANAYGPASRQDTPGRAHPGCAASAAACSTPARQRPELLHLQDRFARSR